MALPVCAETSIRFFFSLLKYFWDHPGTLVLLAALALGISMVFRSPLIVGLFAELINVINDVFVIGTGGIFGFLTGFVLLPALVGVLAVIMLFTSPVNILLSLLVSPLFFLLGFVWGMLPLPLPIAFPIAGAFMTSELTAYLVVGGLLLFIGAGIWVTGIDFLGLSAWVCSSTNSALQLLA